MRGGKQSMRFGLEQINNTITKILNSDLPHICHVIIGDNSSGKSLMLKEFIKKVKNTDEIFFIDAVNRNFDVKKVSRLKVKPEYKPTILETRMEDEFFNLIDTFNCYGTLTERVEMIYTLYEQEVQRLFYKLTGDKFDIMYGNPLGEVEFSNGCGLLSSGYQAILRILLELVYYQDMIMSKKSPQKVWIVIDELDEFLSPKYSAIIFEFLKSTFPWAQWLITTHSCDLVAHTADANLIVLYDNVCEVMDINDYSSVTEVQIVFERVFGSNINNADNKELILRRLLNNKINHAWGEKDEEYLIELQKEMLSASQRIILKEIQDW